MAYRSRGESQRKRKYTRRYRSTRRQKRSNDDRHRRDDSETEEYDSDSTYSPNETDRTDYTSSENDSDNESIHGSNANTKGKKQHQQIVFAITGLDAPSEQGREKKTVNTKNPEHKYYSSEELAYYDKLSEEERAQIDGLETRIKEINEQTGSVPRRFKLLTSEMNEKAKAVVMQKLDYLDRISSGDNEYIKLSTWMDGIMKIPFGKYKTLSVTADSPREDVKNLLVTTKKNLDERVYGHSVVKDHIVRILAQWISNPSGKGIVIGIQGSPGAGKTTLVKEGVCNSLDLPFVFVPLGGLADRTELVGNTYVYEGARWGRIVDSVMKANYMNPVFFFDELDKVSTTKHGDEIINILMQITDSSQNDKFHDSYFSDFEFDLSRSIIIFSYNDENNINPILRDRMIRIETKGYTIQDKLCIAQKHLIPDMLKEFNMSPEAIRFDDAVLRFLIGYVEEEQGVRNFKRALHDVVSNIHLNSLIGDTPELGGVDVSKDHVMKFVHKKNDSANASHLMMYM